MTIAIIALLLSAFAAYGQEVDEISINTMGNEIFEKKKAEIDKLLADDQLSAADSKGLEALRKKAVDVAALNEECKSFDLSSVPNERCNTYYRIELPAFEEEFSRITGNLYLNRISMVAGLNNRMKQIDACVDAMAVFVNPSTRAENLVHPKKLLAGLEPLDEKTAEFYYKFSIEMDQDRVVKIIRIAEQWAKSCEPIVKHTATNEFAPYFLKNTKQFLQNVGFQWEGNNASFSPAASNSYQFSYIMNGDVLFSGNVAKVFPSGSTKLMVFSITSEGKLKVTPVIGGGQKNLIYEGKRNVSTQGNADGVTAKWVVSRSDADRDGVFDGDDRCPLIPEDRDGYMDLDGCPDPDNDQDGIPDTEDLCSNASEDFDSFEDDNGCPDLDNDGDGVRDLEDKCPNRPEDLDGEEDYDGCPEEFYFDKRNKKKYPVVNLYNQKWFGKNLDYEDNGFFASGKTWCYDNKPENCRHYGRLYDYKSAKNACPDGWHIPSISEWKYLSVFVDSVRNTQQLRATYGWDQGKDKNAKNGTDDYGFAALPGGEFFQGSLFLGLNDYGVWRSSTFDNEGLNSNYGFRIGNTWIGDNNIIDIAAGYIRCAKNGNSIH